MLIRKITEYQGVCKTEKILLICDDKDEGWEMTLEELATLRILIEKVLHIPNLWDRINDKDLEIARLGADVDRLTRLDAARSEMIDERNDRILSLETELQKLTSKRDHAAECPDFIEVPKVPESQENLVITEVPIIAEKYTEVPEIVPETAEKVPKNAKKDFSRYIQMAKDLVDPKEIQLEMIDDWGISESTALNYYYARVKHEAAEIIELEKKALEKKLEPKIQRKDDTTNKEKALMQEIAALPEFKTSDDFLVHALVYEIGIDKKGKDLKEIYLKTHPGTKW